MHGKPTANVEIIYAAAMTAAHPSLPLPTLVQVINEDNGREIVVRVNDRGPFDGKHILELSPLCAGISNSLVPIKYLDVPPQPL